jgi:dihydrodipicolinate synthase/N-acetylneuraminate lyase
MSEQTVNAAPRSPTPRGPLRGVFAAALTPLTADGDQLDAHAVGELIDFYRRAGVDGVFVGGTTGESLMLSPEEREQLTAQVVSAGSGLKIAVNAGAQTTAETMRLAAHAAATGVDAVAVAPPPFFGFDETSLLRHFEAAASACAPVPFYLYEIRQRTGYSIPISVVQSLADRVPQFVGMKVSDPTLEELERYLVPGLEIMVGAESLVLDGVERGAVGAVSGLAGALPRHVVDALGLQRGVRRFSLGTLRAGLERFPFHAAGKLTLIAQQVRIEPSVRAPLRPLTAGERTELEDWLAGGVLDAALGSSPVD